MFLVVMSSLERFIMKKSAMLPPVSKSSACKRKSSRDFSPQDWSLYFETSENVELTSGDIFHVYRRGKEGPLLVFLHGGGFSGLSWSLITRQITAEVTCQAIAIDLRGHGETVTSDDLDLSMDRMIHDVESVLSGVFGGAVPLSVLVGHSMGGALATRASHQWSVGPLAAVVVIDVVEGSAVDALVSMTSYLRGRPASFKSIDRAVEWSVRSGLVRNVDSARVSIPGHLKTIEGGVPATKLVDKSVPSSVHPTLVSLEQSSLSALAEHDDEQEQQQQQEEEREQEATAAVACLAEPAGIAPSADTSTAPTEVGDIRTTPAAPDKHEKKDDPVFTWRIDLSATEPHWRDWFSGLSALFLAAPVPKLLLLAAVDRLDRELTIGQMQGKFQMHVLPRSGHAVHEDSPEHVAVAIANFLVRNKLAKHVSRDTNRS